MVTPERQPGKAPSRRAQIQLLTIAARQAGVIGRRQAAAIPGGRACSGRLVRAGQLVPYRGAYLLAGHPKTPETPLWAAVVLTGGSLSHATAAVRHGASLPALPIDVVLPASRRPPTTAGVHVHRTRRLPPNHLRRDAAGLPLTIPPRTIVDLAAPISGLTDTQLRRCLDELIVARTLTIAWLEWFVAHEARSLPGRLRVERMLSDLVDLRIDSIAEAELARVLRRAGLDGFTPQYEVRIGGRFLGRVDVAWPTERLAIELDGYRYHSTPGAFHQDRTRRNDLELAKWRILHVTPRWLQEDPAGVVEMVHRALTPAPRG